MLIGLRSSENVSSTSSKHNSRVLSPDTSLIVKFEESYFPKTERVESMNNQTARKLWVIPSKKDDDLDTEEFDNL